MRSPACEDGVRGLRLAFAETLFFDEVDPEVERAVRESAAVFRSLGAHVESIKVPEAAEAMSEQKRAFAIAAEACVYNARLLDEHFDELDPVVAHRMIGGRQLSAPDYFALHRQWAELRRRLGARLADVDALLVPTTALPSRPLAEVDRTRESYAQHNGRYLRNTAVGNILNLCGVSAAVRLHAGGAPDRAHGLREAVPGGHGAPRGARLRARDRVARGAAPTSPGPRGPRR